MVKAANGFRNIGTDKPDEDLLDLAAAFYCGYTARVPPTGVIEIVGNRARSGGSWGPDRQVGFKMKKSFAFLVFLAAACSRGPTPEEQRITALEQENAQLRDELKQAKDNVAKLQSAMEHGSSGSDAGEDTSGGSSAGQPVAPVPENNMGNTSPNPA